MMFPSDSWGKFSIGIDLSTTQDQTVWTRVPLRAVHKKSNRAKKRNLDIQMRRLRK